MRKGLTDGLPISAGRFLWLQRSPQRSPASLESGDRCRSAHAHRWRIANAGNGLQVGLAIISAYYSTDSAAQSKLDVLS
jgi:hypothetical protein